MSGFLSQMMAEMGARRRRLRAALGDVGQSIAEFGVMSGLLLGSLGLLFEPWMAPAAPWGFALPFVFVGGLIWVEKRRQDAIAKGSEPETIEASHDWASFLLAFGCALAGLAAFLLAWMAAPAPPPQEEIWRPPEHTVDSSIDIAPPPAP